VAVAALMNYWVSPDTVNNAVWVAIAWIVVVILNQFPSGVYGEVEFIFVSATVAGQVLTDSVQY
jgi:amino acid transporter